jgi:hypothetical protein
MIAGDREAGHGKQQEREDVPQQRMFLHHNS